MEAPKCYDAFQKMTQRDYPLSQQATDNTRPVGWNGRHHYPGNSDRSADPGLCRRRARGRRLPGSRAALQKIRKQPVRGGIESGESIRRQAIHRLGYRGRYKQNKGDNAGRCPIVHREDALTAPLTRQLSGFPIPPFQGLWRVATDPVYRPWYRPWTRTRGTGPAFLRPPPPSAKARSHCNRSRPVSQQTCW